MVKAGIFDALLPGRLISTIESEWLGCCWMGMWTPWSSHPYLAFVMAWAITCWPSPIFKGSMARCADLPTHVPAPMSINAASLTSPKLRPSPRDHLP